MNTRTKTKRAIALAALIAGGATYAAAQQQPAQPKPQTQQQPKAQTQPPAQPGTQNAGNVCPQECGCMQDGQHMMGDQHGMMGGQHGMMGGTGDHCPMMDMRAMADVQIENTKNGAIIRMNAKNAAQVAQIQQMAQHMTHCMGSAEPAAPQTAQPPAKAR